MNGSGIVAQTCSLPYRRFVTCPTLDARRHPADCKSAIQQSATLRYPPQSRMAGGDFGVLRPIRLCQLLVLILMLVTAGGLAFAQSSTTNNLIRFRAVDIFVDSGETPLAAYQLEFAATNGNARIVGIEGGDPPAFAQPPFYDPKAMQHERVIIAAFSTEAADKLPKGKTRVATIHVQTFGASEPLFETKLQTAGGADGKKLVAVVSSEERKGK